MSGQLRVLSVFGNGQDLDSAATFRSTDIRMHLPCLSKNRWYETRGAARGGILDTGTSGNLFRYFSTLVRLAFDGLHLNIESPMSSSNLPSFVPTTGFNYVEPPNPEWRVGQGVEATVEGRAWAEGEKAGWKTIDTATEDPRKLNGIFISGVIPRPVAFVSTISEDGVENIAPYSYFNLVSSSPPVISFSSIQSPSGNKDTVRNIKATKGYTVNIISEPWIQQANVCCIDSPLNVSEWPMSGLRKEPSVYVKAPRVKESAFSMECELLQAIEVIHPDTKALSATLVLGYVKFIHIRKDVLDPVRGTVDPGKLKPITRMGGILYGRVSEGYMITRPSWKEDEETIREALGDAL